MGKLDVRLFCRAMIHKTEWQKPLINNDWVRGSETVLDKNKMETILHGGG